MNSEIIEQTGLDFSYDLRWKEYVFKIKKFEDFENNYEILAI